MAVALIVWLLLVGFADASAVPQEPVWTTTTFDERCEQCGRCFVVTEECREPFLNDCHYFYHEVSCEPTP